MHRSTQLLAHTSYNNEKLGRHIQNLDLRASFEPLEPVANDVAAYDPRFSPPAAPQPNPSDPTLMDTVVQVLVSLPPNHGVHRD